MTTTNPNMPNGLSPIRRLDGAKWQDSARVYYVPAAQTNALFVGDPVIKKTGSADVNGVNGVDLAGTTGAVTGVVVGFIGIAVAGSGNEPSFFGLSGTPGPAYRPASTSYDYYVLVNDDPEAEWLVQADNNYGGVSGTPVPVAAVGKNANLKSGTGSVYTGLSGWLMDSNTVATTSTLQLNIIGVYTDAQNAAAALNGKFFVRLNTSTEITGQSGI